MQYYYLISGLPDLSLDMVPRQIDFAETYDTIARNLTEEDLVPYRYLLFANDNRNLLLALFEEDKGRKLASFVQPAVFSEKEIRDYRHQRSRFPSYLGQFLEIYADQTSDIPLSQMSVRLEQLFLEEADSLRDDFVSEWLAFDRTLKAILATYHRASHSFLPSPPDMADAALLRHIGPGKTISTTWAKSYPYLEGLMEALDARDPQKLEREVDHVRWAFVDSFSGFFGRHQVYGYALKLMMIQRIHVLQQQMDDRHLIGIMDDIKKIEREPKTVVI